MINIIKNNSLKELQTIVEQNIQTRLNYMPDSFNEEQQFALELFKKRIFLEQIIDESICFNKKLTFPRENKNLHLTTTAENLVKVFRLRSDVYTRINYQNEFPDTVEGLNFDKYDSTAAILFYENNGIVTGTTRLIFDSKNNLPIEDKFSFNKYREKHSVIGELSRLIVHKETKGLSLEFKYLMNGIYHLFNHNDIDITFLAIIKEHYKLYTKFGGSEIIKEINEYGDLEYPVFILSWKPSEVSSFFKRAFLN